MGEKPTVIYVVDDDVACRTSIGRLLRAERHLPRFYASGEEIIGDAAAAEIPGCLILDLVMPGGMGGLELLERLAAAGRRYPTVILTACCEPETAFRAGKLGATVFLRKPATDTQLLRAIGSVMAAFHANDAGDAERRKAQQLVMTLSPRERQALALLKDERSRKEVAAEMGIGVSTVKYYCDNIYKKLHVHSLRAALGIWDEVRSRT